MKLDEDLFFDGVLRGSRPDGLGIMISRTGTFSARGRFANMKLSGAGRVELPIGEIYDGVFLNGVFQRGVCYIAKDDR